MATTSNKRIGLYQITISAGAPPQTQLGELTAKPLARFGGKGEEKGWS